MIHVLVPPSVSGLEKVERSSPKQRTKVQALDSTAANVPATKVCGNASRRFCRHSPYRAGKMGLFKHFELGHASYPGIAYPRHFLELKNQAEAKVVVPVVGRIVVPVRHPTVPGIVVPASATVHAVRPTCGPSTLCRSIYACHCDPLHRRRRHFVGKRNERMQVPPHLILVDIPAIVGRIQAA